MSELYAIEGSEEGIGHPVPEDLGEAGIQLWEDITEVFDFSDEPHRLAILHRACKVADTIHKLDEAAAEAPLMELGSMKQKVISPLIAESRAQTALLNQLISSLKLPASTEEQLAEAEKRSQSARHAAVVRHGRGGAQ